MTITRAKSKKAAPDICSEISNKISTRGALSVVEATRQNVLEAFFLPSNRDKLLLVATEATSSSLAGFLPVKHHLFKKNGQKNQKFRKVEQSLASAIVTPNSFVVPNKILDEISIALSSTLSKMGQDQPLAMLSNVVSSDRSLLVVEAKQSPPVGSPIKLAYVKTVFQFVHGFLDAKSVPKDNLKLFCMEFAFQQSLEAVFLVELTSSVCLTTLKIAKSLVVSESGSPPAAVVLRNIPLGMSAANVKLALSVFGSITRVVLKPAGIWQYVVVYFKKLDSVDSVRILLLVNQNETILSCDKFKAKLVNLPPGCTAFEISNMISQIGGDLDSAIVKTSTLRKCHIWWETPGCWCCFRCQEMGHLAVDCKISPLPTPKISKVFKSYFVGSVSYAKASAFLDSSEFPPLAVSISSSMVVGNSLMSFRLASLESDLVKLSTLVKSIVKPVGFLVKLFEQFINGDLVSSSKLGLKVNKIMVYIGSFSKIVGKLRREVVSLKKECCMEDINMFGNSEHPVGLDDEVFSNLLSLWEHEPIDVKADALKTAEWLVGLVSCSATLFLVI
ncbi:hypothetical protein G9A89_019903 [Geosiphon pyriformis]|nr:hypothetical protein G9A89_019903 [Geosiphon pyriformis]